MKSFAIAQLDAEIIAKIVNKDTLYYRLGQQPEFDVRVAAWNDKPMHNIVKAILHLLKLFS